MFTCEDIMRKLEKMADVNNTNILSTIKRPRRSNTVHYWTIYCVVI